MRGFNNNVLPQRAQPQYPETSPLRIRNNPRDSDANSKAHLKHDDAGFNLYAIYQMVRQLKSAMDKLRIRSGGGQGGSATIAITGEWDPTRTYSLLQIAVISMGSNAGTYVYISNNQSAGTPPYSGLGIWMQLPMGGIGSWT
jgi:hypothetical protein